MVYNKEKLEDLIKNSTTKLEVLNKLGKTQNSYKTLDKYIKIYNINIDHLKTNNTIFRINTEYREYTKGDKHPIQDLYFWQYRFDRKGTRSFECWYSKDKYIEQNKKHLERNKIYREKDTLATLTRSCLTRQKSRNMPQNGELIDIDYVRCLWNRQNGKCYWFGVNMIFDSKKIISLNKVSIDRINSNNGYVKGNIVLCCNSANKAKSDSSLEDWIEFLKSINPNDKIF